jgi:hypothetical protein
MTETRSENRLLMRFAAELAAVFLVVFLIRGTSPADRPRVIVVPVPSSSPGGLLIPMPHWQQIHEGPQIKPDPPKGDKR